MSIHLRDATYVWCIVALVWHILATHFSFQPHAEARPQRDLTIHA